MDIKKIVGTNIKEFRKRNNITQEQLAELVNIETVSLSKIETGRSYPTSENLAKISQILNVEPFEFFVCENAKTNDELMDEIQKSLLSIKKDSKKLLKLNSFVKHLTTPKPLQ